MVFSEELQNQEAEEGKTAVLCCELSKLVTSVQWKKGTVILKPGKKYEMKQNGCQLQLHIHELTTQDSGVYKCCALSLATTGSVTVKSMSFFLSVYLSKQSALLKASCSMIIFIPLCTEQPLFFCKNLQSLEAKERETAFLSCELSEPGVVVQWKKGAVLINTGNKYKIKQDGCLQRLEIHDLKSQDSGTFKCCVGNLVTTASLEVKGR